MTEMIVVYTTCEDEKEARKIGDALLKKRLATCINIVPGMKSMFWWPPKKNKRDDAEEVILLIKTMSYLYDYVDETILKFHSYETPAIFAIPVVAANAKYLDWIKGEATFVEEGKVEKTKDK